MRRFKYIGNNQRMNKAHKKPGLKLFGTVTSIEECYSVCGFYTSTFLITNYYFLLFRRKTTITILTKKSNLPYITIISAEL